MSQWAFHCYETGKFEPFHCLFCCSPPRVTWLPLLKQPTQRMGKKQRKSKEKAEPWHPGMKTAHGGKWKCKTRMQINVIYGIALNMMESTSNTAVWWSNSQYLSCIDFNIIINWLSNISYWLYSIEILIAAVGNYSILNLIIMNNNY